MYTLLAISIIFQLYWLYKNKWKINDKYFTYKTKTGDDDLSPKGCMFLLQINIIFILIIRYLP